MEPRIKAEIDRLSHDSERRIKASLNILVQSQNDIQQTKQIAQDSVTTSNSAIAKIDSTVTKITSIDNAVSQLNTMLQSQSTLINGLNVKTNDLTALQTVITNQASLIASLSARILSIENVLPSIDTSLNFLSSKSSTLENRISVQESKVYTPPVLGYCIYRLVYDITRHGGENPMIREIEQRSDGYNDNQPYTPLVLEKSVGGVVLTLDNTPMNNGVDGSFKYWVFKPLVKGKYHIKYSGRINYDDSDYMEFWWHVESPSLAAELASSDYNVKETGYWREGHTVFGRNYNIGQWIANQSIILDLEVGDRIVPIRYNNAPNDGGATMLWCGGELSTIRVTRLA